MLVGPAYPLVRAFVVRCGSLADHRPRGVRLSRLALGVFTHVASQLDSFSLLGLESPVVVGLGFVDVSWCLLYSGHWSLSLL